MRIAVVLITVQSLVGCVVEGEPTTEEASAALIPTTCPGRNYAGVWTGGGACPSAGADWTVGSFMPGTTINGLPICRYTYTGPGMPTTVLPFLEQDCPVVVPLVDPAEYVYTTYSQAYRRQMERALLPRLYNKRVVVGPSPVRVAIIDSSPTSGGGTIEPTLGGRMHGRLMSMAIRDLTCPQGRAGASSACIPQFKTYLALDQIILPDEEEPAEPQVPIYQPAGGDFGYLLNLADQINAAVTSWDRAGDLVILLALGWAPEWTHDGAFLAPPPTTVDADSGPAQAVRAAIQRAHCQGALVISAVGNIAAGSISNVGPMLPAAWAEEMSYCPTEMPAYTGRPLLYAVGGVDGTDRPIATSREAARTELVAPAALVTVNNSPSDLGVPAPYLPAATGSSLAAAGTTAAAAAVLAYRPGLEPAEVMQLLFEEAEPFVPSITADVCLGPAPCRQQRRISMCRVITRAMNDACLEAGIACPAPPRCTEIGYREGSNGQMDELPEGVPVAPAVAWTSIATPMCTNPTAYVLPGTVASSDLCPDDFFDTILSAPFTVAGQPPVVGCDACVVFDHNDKFFVSINAQWNPASTILSAMLYVGPHSVNVLQAVGGALPPGFQKVIPIPSVTVPTQALIVFQVKGNAAANESDFTLVEQVAISYQPI